MDKFALNFDQQSSGKGSPKSTATPYYYFSNWDGRKHVFRTLREAKKHAKTDTGISQTIFNQATGLIAACVPASGHVPA